MAITKVINTIQFKRGTKEALTRVLVGENKLLKGEPVWELDSNKIKVGDNVHDYADLPYIYDIEKFYTKEEIDLALSSKQDLLVSGDNIKTINGNSILGEGNLEIHDEPLSREEIEEVLI